MSTPQHACQLWVDRYRGTSTATGAQQAPAIAMANALTRQLSDKQPSQQDPPSQQQAAVVSRPERPTSARRGPPKLPQTGASGESVCQLHHPASTQQAVAVINDVSEDWLQRLKCVLVTFDDALPVCVERPPCSSLASADLHVWSMTQRA